MKIMVIDDEPIVSKALRKLIPWEEHGFQWLPEAYDGQSGLELIMHNQPDLILVDCRMPNMNGLELLTELNRRSYPVRSVILSGHDEFEYAQQAIKLGASDYLLKPPDLELLLRTVVKIKEEWLEERKLKKQLQDNLPLVRYKFIQSLLEGAAFTEEVFLEKVSVLDLKLKQGSFYLCMVQVEEDPDFPKPYQYEDQQLMNFAILNIIEETMAPWTNVYCLMESQHHFMIIVNAEQADCPRLLETLKALVNNIKTVLKYFVTIGVSFPGTSLNKDAKAAYAQAKNALQYKYYTGPNEVIVLDHLEWESSAAESGRLSSHTSDPRYEQFESAFKVCNLEQLNNWLSSYIHDLKERDIPVELTKTITIQWMVEASLLLADIHPQLKRDELLTAEQIAAMLAVTSIAELEKELRQFLESLMRLTTELRKSGSHVQVQKAKHYIKEHYHENISLESISKEVFLSPVYLSFLFKQVEGVNLTDFITQVRLQKAKELLRETPLKTYEIADRVGYQDDKYFSRLFKRKEGVTPTEYRKYNIHGVELTDE